MNGIAERIKYRGDLKRNPRMMPPDIGHWQRDVFGKRTRAIHPYSLGVSAQVSPPGKAVPASAANHVSFATHNHPWMEIAYVRAHLHNLADKLVPNHHRDGDRLTCPFVPIVDMQIRAANAR